MGKKQNGTKAPKPETKASEPETESAQAEPERPAHETGPVTPCWNCGSKGGLNDAGSCRACEVAPK